MKKSIALLFFVISGMYSMVFAQRVIPTIELHLSANHPLETESTDRTFFGAGFGANVVFRDAKMLSFKTGFETNFFHTWNRNVYTGHMSGKYNVHYNLWNLSIPVMLRLNVGKKVRFFVEAGGYLGIPLSGNITSNYYLIGTSPENPGYNGTITDPYDGYFSLSPAVGLGGIFPVSDRIDLFLKPEFIFQKNLNKVDGAFSDFNERFFYVRVCGGIRINLNKIE